MEPDQNTPDVGLWLAKELQRLRQEEKMHGYINPAVIGPLTDWLLENKIDPSGKPLETVIRDYTIAQHLKSLDDDITNYLLLPSNIQAIPEIPAFVKHWFSRRLPVLFIS